MNKRGEMREHKRSYHRNIEGRIQWYYCDSHHEVFNTDCYIIGTHEAKEALEEYGAFNAIESADIRII